MADGYRMTSWAFECLPMPSQWPLLEPSAACRSWRFAALLDKLEKPDAALTRQLKIACDRLFKLPFAEARPPRAVRGPAPVALLILGIVVGLTELYSGNGRCGVVLRAVPLRQGAVLAAARDRRLSGLSRSALRVAKAKGLRWLMRPVGWIAAAGRSPGALPVAPGPEPAAPLQWSFPQTGQARDDRPVIGRGRPQPVIRAGNHRTSWGRAIRTSSLIRSATGTAGCRARWSRAADRPRRRAITNRFMPTGGVIRPISTTVTSRMPNHTGSKPSACDQREDERDGQEDHRQALDEAARARRRRPS